MTCTSRSGPKPAKNSPAGRGKPEETAIYFAILALEVLVTFLNRRWPLPWLIYLETLLLPILALVLVRQQRKWLIPILAGLVIALYPVQLASPLVIVDKTQRSLRLGDLSLPIGLGPTSGPKQRQGDGKTPDLSAGLNLQ
jgi:hypothetical protein